MLIAIAFWQLASVSEAARNSVPLACTCRCAFSNCQHVQEPGCCLREGFERHPLYVELYHEVKQQEDLERHRSMSKKVGKFSNFLTLRHP